MCLFYCKALFTNSYSCVLFNASGPYERQEGKLLGMFLNLCCLLEEWSDTSMLLWAELWGISFFAIIAKNIVETLLKWGSIKISQGMDLMASGVVVHILKKRGKWRNSCHNWEWVHLHSRKSFIFFQSYLILGTIFLDSS